MISDRNDNDDLDDYGYLWMIDVGNDNNDDEGDDNKEDKPCKESSRKVKVKEVEGGESNDEEKNEVKGEAEAVEESVALRRIIIWQDQKICTNAIPKLFP